MKKALVGLALALTLGACGTASGLDYARLDAAMNQNPAAVTQICEARADAASQGFTDDQVFGAVEALGGFDNFPADLGLTDRQIYDRIVSRC